MQDTADWTPVELPLYGAALRVPPGWETLPPKPANGEELIRLTGGTTLEGIVFKLRSHARPAAEIATRTRDRLQAGGYSDFVLTDQPFAGRAGARLRFRSTGRTGWEHFAVRGPAVFVLALSSADPDADAPLVEALASTFRLG